MALTRFVLLVFVLLAATGAQAQIAFRAAAQAGGLGSAAIGFRAAASAAANSGVLTLTINKPTGTVQDDVMVASIGHRPATATVTPPSGWVLVRDVRNTTGSGPPAVTVYRKVAGASEPANYAWTFSSSTGSAGGIQAFSGVDTTTPVDVENGAPVSPAAYAQATPSITTTVANTMLVTSHFIGNRDLWANPPTWGGTQGFQVRAAANPAMAQGSWALQAAIGATGTKTATDLGPDAADTGAAHILALRPGGPNLTINKPTGTVQNDVMIATIVVRPSTIAITAPAGWTALARIDQTAGVANSQQRFFRVATAAEPASYTWTIGGGSTGAAGGIASYSGVDTVTPFDVFAGNVTPSGTTHTANSVTTTVPNTMVVSAHSFSSSELWTPPAGMTERVDVSSLAPPNAAGIALEMADVIQAAAGATGAKTATAGGSADTGVAHLIALRPNYTHYAVSYPSGANIATCEPALVRIEAHHAGHGFAAPRAGTVLTINTSSASGVWLSPAVTGTGVWTPSGANNGVATYTWPGTEAVLEVRLRHNTPVALGLNLADTQVKSEDGTEDPTLTFADSVLRVTADGASSATVGTQIAGKRSDTGFGAQTLFVQAVSTAPSGVCTTLFQNQTLSVDFAAQCNNPATCSLAVGTAAEVLNNVGSFISVAKNNGPAAPSSYTPVSLTFSNDANAMAPLVLRYGDAGQVTLFMRAPLPAPPAGTFASGSSNAFVVRPFGIAFRGATAGTPIQHNSTPGAPLLVPAGDNFTMTLAAYKWAAGQDVSPVDGFPDFNPADVVDITGNGFTPSFALDTPVGVTLNLPGVSNGAIDRASTPGASTVTSGEWSGGAATVADWRYSEAGNVVMFSFTTTYITAGINILGSSSYDGSTLNAGHVGRFRPKHFSITATPAVPVPVLTNRSVAACGPASTFTYLNEGLGLTFTLTAQNTQNATTLNYTGVYAKHDPTAGGSNDPKIAFGLGARGTTPTPSFADLTGRLTAVYNTTAPAWLNGQLSVAGANSVRAAIARATPDDPDGPFTGTLAGIAPTDTDGVAMNTLDLDVDTFGGNDHKDLGVSTILRFGRLRMLNAVGSEKIGLAVPIQTQYWNGSAFVTNTADSCTVLPQASIALSGETPGMLPAPNCRTFVEQTPNVTFASAPPGVGVGTLTLAKTAGNAIGSLRLTARLGAAGAPPNYCTSTASPPTPASDAALGYLLGRWNDAADPDGNAMTAYDDNPSARAAFGVYGAQPKSFIFFRENY